MSAKRESRDGRALYRAVNEQQLDDEIADLEAMSDEELDRHIAEGGGDPKAIRAAGEALVRELESRPEWHGAMGEKIARFQKLAASSKRTESLPRDEILRRIEAARNDARFTTSVTALFQKKTPEASTDEELANLLERIELLAKLSEDEGE